MKVVALVGMPGAGKSEVARIFKRNNFLTVRFGDVTDEEVRRKGLVLNEENERSVREELRRVHGMVAYAVLNLPRIEKATQTTNVVIDGLYSWEEYKYLTGKLAAGLITVAVWAPPELRYRRLQSRKIRPLTLEQARPRDIAEIENINKGGPIAMADFTIKNDGSLAFLVEQTNAIIEALK